MSHDPAAIPDTTRALLADVREFLAYVGRSGLPLTDTGRLRLADVRAINGRFREPAELDQRIGRRVFRLRFEDEAWRVHFLRLACETARLLRVRRPRIRATPRAEAFAALPEGEAARLLFAAWWRYGPWEYWDLRGGFAARVLDDRMRLARALERLGTEELGLEKLGERIRAEFAPDLQWEEPYLSPAGWGSGVWHSCLGPLAAFGGCEERRGERHGLRDLRVGLRLTPFGLTLLRSARTADVEGALARLDPATRRRAHGRSARSEPGAAGDAPQPEPPGAARAGDDWRIPHEVEVKIGILPWEHVDEVRRRAIVHQRPDPKPPRRGEGLPVVAIYGNGGRMRTAVEKLRADAFAGILMVPHRDGARLVITTAAGGVIPALDFAAAEARAAARQFRRWRRASGIHGLVIFDEGLWPERPDAIPAFFEATSRPEPGRGGGAR